MSMSADGQIAGTNEKSASVPLWEMADRQLNELAARLQERLKQLNEMRESLNREYEQVNSTLSRIQPGVPISIGAANSYQPTDRPRY